MTTAQVSEEEFDYQLLFKPTETPLPAPDELSLIEKYLKQLSAKELPGEPYVRDYLHDQKRRHCRPSTMRGNFATLLVFLTYLKQERGKTFLETITRDDVSSFIEHEQDRGMQPNTVSTRLQLVYAFLRYLVDQEVAHPDLLKRKFKVKVPEALPRAIDREDIQQLLAVIDQPRDRAMILVLLRTGMRIGELLATRMSELNLREKQIIIMEAQKTRVGRVAYLSEDACKALTVWLNQREPAKERLFYGQGREQLSYTAIRMRFAKYLEVAGLAHKGYSLHCLRHTCATELLNAGMRLECLQQLLGHSSIEMTRRYARLTDNTRREEYFRAMAIIEKGELYGHYRRHPELPPVLEEKELLSPYIKNYMHTLKQFVVWVDVPIETVTHKKLLAYLDHLLDRGLKPKTINCHLDSIRGFYHYLIEEEQVAMINPVKRGYALRLSRPLPRHLRDEEVARLLQVVHHPRDRAMVMLMLRCGLRVEEVSRLNLAALDLRRSQVFVHYGKGAKDRVVYLSDDAYEALVQYLRVRPASRIVEVFLVDKGRCRVKAISVRGIQKRLEYYARQARLKVSCHQLRHTMATQLLNADAALVTIQDLLGHTRIKTTQRYCRVSNLKVQRDYHRAMAAILQITG